MGKVATGISMSLDDLSPNQIMISNTCLSGILAVMWRFRFRKVALH